MTSHVFYRGQARNLPTAIKGKGIFIVDREGRRYLDASGGADGDGLVVAPPFVIKETEMDTVAAALRHAVHDVLSG